MSQVFLAFLSGAMGAMIGGTASFVVTGFVGILVILIDAVGGNSLLLNEQVLNFFFMPCICFNGATAAMAFAANWCHHPMNGADGNRSLYFTGDPWVILVGGLFGMVGYGFYTLFDYLNVPIDIGALVVIIVNSLIRFLFGTHKYIHHPEQPLFRKATRHFWVFQCLFAIIISLSVAYFVDLTDVTSIGFSISALSLIFAFSHPEFPASHHISIIAGYAMVATGSFVISAFFGILSQIIFIVFTNYFNTDLDTHVDGPAAAIAPLSFIIFTLF